MFFCFGQKQTTFDPSNARLGESIEYCHTHKKMAKLKANTEFQKMQKVLDKEYEKIKKEKPFLEKGVVYTIPVVFHVLHNGGIENISDEQIAQGLRDIERFINTVDKGICAHPESVKMMLYETILFAFSAPFVNQLHTEKMRVAQIANRRGPKHLLLYGPGGNGKTVIGRYLNFLITGKVVNPVSAKQWGKKQWENLFRHIQLSGSSYPVIIDDIKDTCFRGKRATLEGPVKSHWEENWRRGLKFPVMILNSNHEELEEWAKSRVRRLELNIKHKSKAEDMKLLNELMSTHNHVFAAFSQRFISPF